jgi:hypothetical protein
MINATTGTANVRMELDPMIPPVLLAEAVVL